jgi:hypothetical protein
MTTTFPYLALAQRLRLDHRDVLWYVTWLDSGGRRTDIEHRFKSFTIGERNAIHDVWFAEHLDIEP